MIINGNWGACQWTVSEDGKLVIYEGMADDISSEEMSPWYDHREEIKSVSFSGRVHFDEGASLACMFKDCSRLETVDLTNLDTAGVTSMTSMFEGCSSMKEIELGSLDMSRVNSVSGMFNSCDSLTKIELSGIDTSKLVSMIGMFMNCKSLEDVDLSPLNTSRVVDMSWLFCGCENLKRADLSELDTSNVMDMSCMFISCESLEEVILGEIDMTSVMDTSRMFMYCRNLRCVDAAGVNNGRTEQADDMFLECDRLSSVIAGDQFSIIGNGNATIVLPESRRYEDTEMVSDWRKTADGTYYKQGTLYYIRYKGNGAGGEMSDASRTAGDSLNIPVPEFKGPDGAVFKEWNVRRNGSGRSYRPGEEIQVHSDMTLYAIWAEAPAVIREYDIPPMIHGDTVSWALPQAESPRADITGFITQIKRPGSSEWVELSDDETMVYEDNGSQIRYKVTNFVGSTYTDPVKLEVFKADYDMTEVHWVIPEDLSYDGQEKTVLVEGLPEGVKVSYLGNKASDVGEYTATATFTGDEIHYNKPNPIAPLKWSITRGKYEMDDIGWNYMEAFVYDGTEKKIRLEGLPDGTTPYYDGADGIDAGVYKATAGLDYDIDRYDKPEGIRPCTWEILKTTHDMSGVRWDSEEVFTYDGGEKKVELTGLPSGVVAQYTGNCATEAGQYTARAAFVVADPKNYFIPDPIDFQWEIKKADHDLSEMKWSCNSFVYDGEEKEIHLEGIPEGVDVSYEGTTGRLAGAYLARAEFIVQDLKNYNPIQSWTSTWQISKASFDMSKVRWNYSSPYVYNGAVKSVALKNLPEGVEASYESEMAFEAGDYVAKATLIFDEHNFERPKVDDCPWQILKATPDVSGIGWEYNGPFTYNGSEQGVYLTTVPTEFTVSYADNRAVNAGQYTAKAYLSPVDSMNYKDPDPLTCKWQIERAVFPLPEVHWDSRTIREFDGEEKTVEITNLPQGLKVRYSGNTAVDAGEYVARAEFDVEDDINFFPPEPLEADWNIDRALLDTSHVSWSSVREFTYDGREKGISLTGVPEGIEVRYEGATATDAGEYSARAELIPPEESNYRTTTVFSQNWKINKANIDVSGAYWNDPGQIKYDGTEKFVSVLGLPASIRPMYDGDRHTKAGEYEARVSLIPVIQKNYLAPEFPSFTWKIEKGDVDMSSVIWTRSEELKYDGEEKTVVIENLPDVLMAEYEGNVAVDAGQYVATATFYPVDERNYNTPDPIQHTWSIGRGDIDVSGISWQEEREYVYDGTEKTLLLENVPDSVRVSYKGNCGIDSGQYMASAVLEPVDVKNYNIPAVEPMAWEIKKADLDISGISWVSAERLVYDGRLKVVGLTGLPDEVEVEYENNTATEAGTYHASAVLSVESRNYQAPTIRGCTWTIDKAPVDMSNVGWNYVIDFTYDGYAKRVELIDLPEGMSATYTGNEAIEAGDYTAEAFITLEDSVNYETPVIEPLHWKILKSDYDFSETRWVGREGQMYDGGIKEVTLEGLPDGVEPIYEGSVAADAGTYQATATFLYDENNFNPPEEMHTEWTIEKAPFDISGVRWDYEGPVRASRKAHTVELLTEDGPRKGGLFGRKAQGNYLGLPEGSTVRYEGNTAKEPGVYEAKAYLDIPEQPNHEVKEPILLVWEIVND